MKQDMQILQTQHRRGGGVPELDEHMGEVGNCIENVSAGGGGTHILARCVLHFN